MSFLLNPYRFAVAGGGDEGGGGGVTFNEAKTAAALILSEGDTVVTNDGTNSSAMAMASPPAIWDEAHQAAKLYWEIEIIKRVHAQAIVGVCRDNVNVETAGAGDLSTVWEFRSDGFVRRGGLVYKGTPNAAMAWGTGDVVQFSIASGRITIGVNGTYFYYQDGYQTDTAPASNPLTAYTLPIIGGSGTIWLPFCAPRSDEGSMRLVTQAADFNFALPTGYTALADYVPA